MARGIANKSLISFNAGELSPKLDARIDLDKYNTGCRILENAFVEPYGAAVRRPGTQYVASTKTAGKKAKLVGFKFSTSTNRMLEFGDGYIRFYAGGTTATPILDAGVPVEVAAPWSESHLFDLQTMQINDVVYVAHPDFPTYKLSRLSDTAWTLAKVEFYYPPFLDENVDDAKTLTLNGTALTSNFDVFQAGHVGSHWQVAHLREAEFVELKIEAANAWASKPAWVAGGYAYSVGDYVIESGTKYLCVITHNSDPVFANDLASGYWNVSTVPDYTIDQRVTNGGNTYKCLVNHVAIDFATDLAALKWELVAAGLTSDTLPVRGDWNVRTYGIWSADIEVQRSLDGGTAWDTIRKFRGREDRNVDATGNQVEDSLFRVVLTNVTTPTDPGDTQPRVVIEAVDAYVYGLAKITTVTDARTAVVTVIDAPLKTTATPYWAEGAWSDVRGYPRALTLHEQRLCFGGTKYQPQTIWGSVTGDFENFAKGTNDTDSFAYTLGSTEFNAILWFVSQGRLLVGTTGGEWSMWSGDQGIPITPSAVKVDQHAGFGSKPGLQAMLVNDVVLFVQRQGRKVREVSFSLEKDGYVAPDLTLLAEHVTKGGVVQMAYQGGEEVQRLWIVTGEGKLVCMTYQRDQNVTGWQRHPMDGVVESVATVYGDADDEVWMIVRRTVGGAQVRYIERLNPAKWTAKADAFFVDCGKTYSGAAATSITGLGHLEGRTVQVLADGAVETDKVVTGGAVTLDYAASTVHVGLGFETIVKPMRIDVDPQLGPSQGLVKQVRNLVLRFMDTLGAKYGDGKGAYESIPFRDTDDVMDASPALFTGDKEVQFPGEFETEGDVVVKQDQPLPMTLLAIVTKHQVTGK